jgi:peptidase E
MPQVDDTAGVHDRSENGVEGHGTRDRAGEAGMSGRILACGGGGDFDRFLLALSDAKRPRVCYLPTAVGDMPAAIVRFYQRFVPLSCDPFHVELFGMPERPAERVASADVVLVSGGNTANMLAIWRVHGVDEALREAWARGAVLGGGSAGANCWFDASITDSFGPALAPLTDGLGLLTGSFCPHYDSEERRRPVYRDLVAGGSLPPGIACDDAAAALYEGTELAELVASGADARAFRVTTAGEEALDVRAV